MIAKEFPVARKSVIEKFVDLPQDWVEQINQKKVPVLYGDGIIDTVVGTASDFDLRDDWLYCKVTLLYGVAVLEAHLIWSSDLGVYIRLASSEWFEDASGDLA